MKTLRLIRHSLTVANELRQYYGSTDVPLSENGRALCVRERGAIALPTDVCFATSGMLRAEETLSLLFGEVPHEVLPDLREMDLGKFECQTYEQLKDDVDYQAWLSDADGSFVIPGGESNAAFTRRVVGAIRELLRDPREEMLVVCHAGTIRRAMCALFPQAGRGFFDWNPVACHGYAVLVEGGVPVSYEEI